MSINGRNIGVPTLAHRRFIAMKERYATELGLKAFSNGDMFIAILKLAEEDSGRLTEIVRCLPKSSQG